jgi:hypothetical protein
MALDTTLDHVGIVVPALEPALEQLSSQLGLQFELVFDDELVIHQPGTGNRGVHLRIAYSVQRPHLEVIEAVPGTPWAPERAGLHHLAYFADDLRAESRRLAGPCPIEICGVGADGATPTTFTYHTGGIFRVELLARRTV